MVSDRADEICVPLVRSDTFVNEEHGVRIIFPLDGSKLIVVATEEGFLPVELVSRGLKQERNESVGVPPIGVEISPR